MCLRNWRTQSADIDFRYVNSEKPVTQSESGRQLDTYAQSSGKGPGTRNINLEVANVCRYCCCWLLLLSHFSCVRLCATP